jgi:iduronate 2-sulfatase
LVESVDLYPTLCELAGLPTPEKLDGMSLVRVLKDSTAETRPAAIHVYPRGNRLGRAVRTPRYRLVEWKVPGAPPNTAEVELYDYETDPDETKNLATEKPAVVAELRAILNEEPEAKRQWRRRKEKAVQQ